MKNFNLLLSILCFCLINTHVSAQTIRYVKASGTGDGSSWANASGDIQAMVNASSSGDRVWIAGGNYSLTATLDINEGVNIYGGFAGNENNINQRPKSDVDSNGTIENWEFTYSTVLDGQEAIQVLYVYNSTIDGVTVSNGRNSGHGGGIYMVSGQLVNSIIKNNETQSTHRDFRGGGICGDSIKVSNCMVKNNRSVGGGGGGIYLGKGEVIDCIFRENTAMSYGGAIYGYSANVSGCIVENNTGGDAGNYANGNGGIYVTMGNVTDCIVRGNESKAYPGAGICIGGFSAGGPDSLGIVSNCTVENNRVSSLSIYGTTGGIKGGAGYGVVIVRDCIMRGNSGYFGGGGNYGTFINCTFDGNSAVAGGGISGGTAINCIFTGNSANSGGGMSDGVAINCTFAGNSAANSGGGMSGGTTTNCIFWGNTAKLNGAQIWGISTDGVNHSAIENGCNVCGDGTGNISIAADNENENNGPWFVNPEAGDYRLQACSPCINVGDNSALSTNDMTDLAGNPRIYDNMVDMGTYEFQGGTCQSGCTDRYAENYDPDAVMNDNSCIYRKIEGAIAGCTDDTAVNYNPVATGDDGSCIFQTGEQPVYGCTDCKALNYNPQATDYETGSCVYSDVENTYFVAKEEITKTPVDTIAARPIEECDLTAGAGITSAIIWSTSSKGGNIITAHWQIVQNGNPVYYDVDYSVTREGLTLFYLSVVCKPNGLRASADVTGYTVSAVANVYFSNDIYRIEEKTDAISVYPNPTNGILYIETPTGLIPTLKLYNLQGVQLLESKGKEIDLSGFDKGMYLLQVDDKSAKVVKE